MYGDIYLMYEMYEDPDEDCACVQTSPILFVETSARRQDEDKYRTSNS